MAVLDQTVTDQYAIYNGDSCEVLPQIPSSSVGMSIYSPPFAELYNYSSSDRDMSNCATYEQFLAHYAFVVKEVSRVTQPGRLSVVHCMDLKFGQYQRDFPGDIIRLHADHGMNYHSRHTIWKEPLKVAVRTRSKGLMHKQLVSDSTWCRSAGADFIVAFRKSGDNANPVGHPDGLTSYAGQREVPAHLASKFRGWKDPKTNKLSHWIWQQYASSVWIDVRGGRVLQYKQARENEDEKHCCPLQLDVIERCLTLYSNPCDTVLTPFMGVGSEVYTAVRMGRRAIGIELKPSYFRQAQKNIAQANDTSPNIETLFEDEMFEDGDSDGEE